MTALARPLILGGSGFVGRELMEYLSCPGTSSSTREGFSDVDATNPGRLLSVLSTLRPGVVINCVGLADVDRAEREPALAEELNHRVVEHLVTVQRELPFELVQISTDYVFDGERGNYAEEDPTHPVNQYGESKLKGEHAVEGSSSALIVRISSPFGRGFGARKPQFFRYVVDTLRAGKPVRALTDQRVTATFLPDLARAITTLVERGTHGVVHVGSTEPLTRFEFARKVAETVGADPDLVHPGLRSEMAQWVARRPADTSLSVRRSERVGVRYTSVAAALRELLND